MIIKLCFITQVWSMLELLLQENKIK
jgi:hypothetical protein